MSSRKWTTAAAVLLTALHSPFAHAQALSTQEELGKFLFFDANLSDPNGQACASCHDPNVGFAEPDQRLPVSEGVIPGRFGTRNAPAAAYAVFFPEFTLKGGVQGGQFWDGRAANLTEQAKAPFLNPVEMNNPDKATVMADVLAATYYMTHFVPICGEIILSDPSSVEATYDCMAESIAAFEGTSELNPFTAKFDAVQAGAAQFTAQEQHGLDLFTGRGKCAHCHSFNRNDPFNTFTDSKFHNIGLPANREIFSLVGGEFVDRGLGGFLNDPKEDGKFKTEHLRNIELTAPFMHNGVLDTLKQVVHFYNTRDVLPPCDPALGNLDPGFGTSCWAEPEIPDNLDSSFVGDLGLTDEEEDAIVAFMLTLTDGWTPPAPNAGQ